MALFRPSYPQPLVRTGNPLLYRLKAYKLIRSCSLAALMDKSYTMKMGEFWMPLRRFFIVNEPPLIDRVLSTEAANFPKSDIIAEMLELLMGDSIFVSNGEVWKRQRRMMNPAFEHARIKVVFNLMRQAAEASLARLLAKPGRVRIDQEMTHVAADIIFRTIFSRPLEAEEARIIFAAFWDFQEMAFSHGMARTAGLPKLFTWAKRRKAARSAAIIRGVLDPMVKARYDAFHAGRPGPEQDILASLISIKDDVSGTHFSYRELCEQVSMLFLAGHETSASALAWSLHLISRDQQVQDRLHAEAKAVLKDGLPEFSHMKRLNFTRNVFRESLRLFPPVAFLPREASCPVTMRDKHIKPGAIVNVSPWLMHRHRTYWRDPDAFDPARFERAESEEAQRCAYLPFSAGQRVCLGAAFALQEATLILAMLVEKLRFDPVPGFEPKPVGRLTVRSENGIELMVHPRTA
jgi:cytochrome P450